MQIGQADSATEVTSTGGQFECRLYVGLRGTVLQCIMENVVVWCGCKLDIRAEISLEENCLLTSLGC